MPFLVGRVMASGFTSHKTTGNEPKQVWKVQDGGTPIQLTKRGGKSPAEGPDGFVYYSKTFRSDEIWKVPSGGGQETLVLKAPGLDSWSWALGSAGIYFITESNGGKGVLFFYEFDTRKVLSLMLFDKRVVEPALSPDGTSLIFFQIDQWEQTIMLVNHFR